MRWIPFITIDVISAIGLIVILASFRGNKNFKWLILVWIYLTGLGIILFTPISFDGLRVYIMDPGIGHVNKSRLYLHGLGFLENIVLTVPLGIILKKFVPQLPIIFLALIGVILSGGIEITQYYLSQNFFINRSSDINDVISNTLGVVIGCLIMVFHAQTQKKLVE